MATKGPSIDAIRRFKEQQELKKREEVERRIKEKLTTLEFRSNQGDRKAKSELKKFRERIDKPPPPPISSPKQQIRQGHQDDGAQHKHKSKPKPPPETFDFSELMKLAKQNNNQIRERSQPSQPAETLKIPKKKAVSQTQEPTKPLKPMEPERSNKASKNVASSKNIAPPSSKITESSVSRGMTIPKPSNKPLPPSRNMTTRGPPSKDFRHMNFPRRPVPTASHYDEDDYESDGFVVSDGDDDARAELNETLRSVFRYDRRRCDLREQELDRQYRAIGNVTTFEDLEREERRAARLAAAEDARELREEEERKRLKKIRLEKALKGGRRK